MNKEAVVTQVSELTGFTKKDVSTVVDTTLKVITNALAQKETVEFHGFGRFEARKRDAHVARNPKTGENINVSEKFRPVFVAGKTLKKAVN